MLELEFDGLFRPSPVSPTAGIMCVGWLVRSGGNILAKGYAVIARGTDATSNIAEYLAMIEGLQALIDMRATRVPIRVIGDARVVLDQMSGICKVSAERLQPIHARAVRLARKLNIFEWHWVPRRFNRAADLLSRKALRDFRSSKDELKFAWEQVARDCRAKRSRLRPLMGIDFYTNCAAGIEGRF